DAIAFLESRMNLDRSPRKLFSVLDVGVGSGAIACTIAAEVLDAAVEGTDTSVKALKVAEHNARRLQVMSRCKFHYGDLGAPIQSRTFDLVVANLPYVPTSEIAAAPDPVSFEPRAALDGGSDGLHVYRRFLESAGRLLRSGSLLLMEAAPPTIPGLYELAEVAFPHAQVEVARDYGQRDRYIRVQIPGG
nr:HemK family protein methyltransferase [Candidatus Eremiobacteraeota bacterium]